MLDAVLFDWGDTLMRFEWNEEVALAGNQAGVAALRERADLPDVAAINAYFLEREGHLFDETREDEVLLDDIVRECFDSLGTPLGDEELRAYMDAAHAVWDGYTVESTTHALLEALRRRGLRLAIVSNSATPLRYLEPVLARQGLPERVDVIVFSCEVGKRKPHPLIFQRALDALDVSAANALFVGDRLYHDVRGAGQLGMTTVQALWARADDHPEGWEPDYQAFTQMDVLNIVRRVNDRA